MEWVSEWMNVITWHEDTHYNGVWRPEDGFIVDRAAMLPTVDRVVQRPTSFTWAYKLKTAVGSTADPGGRGV